MMSRSAFYVVVGLSLQMRIKHGNVFLTVADPYWFVNPAVVSAQFIADFPGAAYLQKILNRTVKKWL